MPKNKILSGSTIWLIVLVLLIIYFFASRYSTMKSHDKGKRLAKQYCSSCHAFPQAEILPTRYWGRVLPVMGFFLGAGKSKFEFEDYRNPVAKKRLSESGLFPEFPVLSTEDWIAINEYYLYNSPADLKVEPTASFDQALEQFTAHALPWKSTHEGISFLNFQAGHYEIGYYTESESYYLTLDKSGKEIQRTKTSTPLADLSQRDDESLLLLMGKLNNIDEPSGSVFSKNDSLKQLIHPLERPISFAVEDFDNDGKPEILVAEFGKFLGGINLYTTKDSIRKMNLHVGSGAVKIVVKDVNQDNLKDFYVLVTQADESVYLFRNSGNLHFEKKRLLRLPAHYGTTHFEVLDFDGDQDDDIICSSGDSGDYGIVPKPFHGLRLFENLGEDTFEQVWFYPQQGAYGTASFDYDQDGDIDIASIGYFAAHMDRDRELFIYFENQSTGERPWQFEPHGLKGEENDCWILIDTADVDQDGDLDILLGANSKVLKLEDKAAKLEQWQQRGGMVTVLKNTLVE